MLCDGDQDGIGARAAVQCLLLELRKADRESNIFLQRNKQSEAKEKFVKTTYGDRARLCLRNSGLIKVPFYATQEIAEKKSASLLKHFRLKALTRAKKGKYVGFLDAKDSGVGVKKLPKERRFVYAREVFGEEFNRETLLMAETLEAVMRALVEGCLAGVTAETRVGILCALGCLAQVSRRLIRITRLQMLRFLVQIGSRLYT